MHDNWTNAAAARLPHGHPLAPRAVEAAPGLRRSRGRGLQRWAPAALPAAPRRRRWARYGPGRWSGNVWNMSHGMRFFIGFIGISLSVNEHKQGKSPIFWRQSAIRSGKGRKNSQTLSKSEPTSWSAGCKSSHLGHLSPRVLTLLGIGNRLKVLLGNTGLHRLHNRWDKPHTLQHLCPPNGFLTNVHV